MPLPSVLREKIKRIKDSHRGSHREIKQVLSGLLDLYESLVGKEPTTKEIANGLGKLSGNKTEDGQVG